MADFFKPPLPEGSYQEGLTTVVQGVPPGLLLSEKEIYADLLLRKPGADELSSPRKRARPSDNLTGVNAADTIEMPGIKTHERNADYGPHSEP